ncbi:MAG: hypothetical protein QM813_22680 [Verrucomicrobiota bacterium]
MQLSAAEKKIAAKVLKPDSSLGMFGKTVLTIWIMLSLLLACYLADHYLLLIWVYGVSRVFKEGLYFTYMPSSKSADDYLVSNGDHISKSDSFVSFPMAVAVWLALSLTGYLVIRHCSHLKKKALLKKAINDA